MWAEPWVQRVIRSIVEQCSPSEVLLELCQTLDACAESSQTAVFLLSGDHWNLTAHNCSSERARAYLEECRPSRIAASLLHNGRLHAPFEFGSTRLVYSGAGELMGILMGICGKPVDPDPEAVSRIEFACHLAALSIEQSNLLHELAFQTDSDLLMALWRRSQESEASVQHITRMIAKQCPPEDILTALCHHMGESDAERRVLFFLLDGDHWKLAANGVPADRVALALDPPRISDDLFESGGGREESAFHSGWARHLYSGAGELLGLMVGLSDGPVLPFGLYKTRTESVCRLAALAVEQHNLLSELAFQADHDSLTGLLNRDSYARVLRNMLGEQPPDRHTALIYVDLDRLRQVNDVMGMAVGSRVLQQAGRRFLGCLHDGEILARVGGDEFGVLLPNLSSEGDSGRVARRLLQSLAEPFLIDGHELVLSASIGIGRSSPESTPESLEREAYVALYQAKRSGLGRWAYFSPSMRIIPPERLEMEKRLRFAIERGELLLHYQPKIDLHTGKVSGAEALLRWRPEGLGLVSPASFIPVLEETGLIVDVGAWVLREACRQARRWGAAYGPMRIAVNVSAIQFAAGDFVASVSEIIDQTGCSPDLLELELTETVAVRNLGGTRDICRVLQQMGISFALDDFGTGQSSLSYLHELPIQSVKVDQSFIRSIADGEHPPLVETIIRMAHGLGMEVVAEGVETKWQADLLSKLGCQKAQGFFYSPPVPAADFERLCSDAAAGVLLSSTC